MILSSGIFRIWDISSGKQVKCIKHSEQITSGHPYCADTCLVVVSAWSLYFQNIRTEKIYFEEKQAYAKHNQASLIRKDNKRFVILRPEEVAVFNCEKEMPVSFTTFFYVVIFPISDLSSFAK